jgi:MFS family permease
MFAIIQTSSLFTAPLAGYCIDRYHRLACLAVALFIGGIGYTVLGFQEHPFGPMGVLGAVLVGVGQMSVILTVTGLLGLLGQETPIDVRGSVIGLAGLCGATGILLTSFAGGYLFDHWMISGPILLVGVANFAVFALAFAVWLADGRPVRFDPSEAKSSDFAALGH